MPLTKQGKICIPIVLFVIVLVTTVCIVLYVRKNSIPVQDPLLEYILADKIVSPSEHNVFLAHLSQPQREVLWKAAKGETEIPEEITVEALNEAIHSESNHWLVSKFKNFDYTEMVRSCAIDMDYPVKDAKYATTFQLEHYICDKTFNEIAPEERERMLKENEDRGFGWRDLLRAEAVLAAALLAGPTGAGAAVAIVYGGSNKFHTINYIIQIHSIKVQTLTDSGIEIERYLSDSPNINGQ